MISVTPSQKGDLVIYALQVCMYVYMYVCVIICVIIWSWQHTGRSFQDIVTKFYRRVPWHKIQVKFVNGQNRSIGGGGGGGWNLKKFITRLLIGFDQNFISTIWSTGNEVYDGKKFSSLGVGGGDEILNFPIFMWGIVGKLSFSTLLIN